MTDGQVNELFEELKWAKIEAGQAHMMVASLQDKLQACVAENVVLTRCLGIAAGYISSTPGYTHMHPQQVADMIRNAVLRGDEEDDLDEIEQK